MGAERLFVAGRVLVESVTLWGCFALVAHFGSRESWAASLGSAAVFTLIMMPVYFWLGRRQRQPGNGRRRRFRSEWAVERYSSGAWWGFAAFFAVFAGLGFAMLASPPLTPVSVAAPIMFGALTVVCAVQGVRARKPTWITDSRHDVH